MEQWHKTLPHGPLTHENYKKLSLSFYDEGEAGIVAQARGITQEDFMKVGLGELTISAQGWYGPWRAALQSERLRREGLTVPDRGTPEGTFALFVALERIEIWGGRSTPDKSMRVLRKAFDLKATVA